MVWKQTGVALSSVGPGTSREVTLDGSTVLLVRLADRVYAVEGICPHQGGILADGTLDGSSLKCPEHGATFNVTTGEVLADPDGIVPPQGGVDPLRHYPTRVQDGLIDVDIP